MRRTSHVTLVAGSPPRDQTNMEWRVADDGDAGVTGWTPTSVRQSLR